MSFTNLIYFVVIARENLQNLFQKLLKPKKLPSKSLPVEEIKIFFLIQADQHSKCFYHKILWSFSFDINKKFKKKLILQSILSQFLKSIGHTSIELLEANLNFTVKLSDVWRERGYITAEGLYLEFLEDQQYKAINFAQN